ncbi:subtype B tannase [Clostridium sp. SM-530-WT-3G]|uniref:subtype B tannase n=1 Tax=Clostridium sp. SM-530-WT-3G TaxID=2725303 RepID=UPI00145E8CCA|nr:subtype B tannase [Clostridium sp. SM-530-WT-3G]NME82681.1 alpha/beta hydrolase [Clostridium sp. SM-530-WT-3G]
MKSKMIVVLLAATFVVSSLAGCSNSSNTSNSSTVDIEVTENITDPVLNFDKDNYKTETINVNGQDVTFRAYENVVYVAQPVDTKYQCMNIYIPEAYFNGESIGDFTADTAPIFLPNNVDGYMPAEPETLSSNSQSEGTPNSLLMAIQQGYVVASPGARGRTNENSDGTYYGKAPAAIVDLKAAVSYLHYNDDAMPGTADKIISNGTGAGGAMSSLLGATGNNEDYKPYLQQLGAASASDAVYAASCYGPTTNLDNADMGYEWLFNGINNYTTNNTSLTQTADQMKYSDELKAAFPAYINGLNLLDQEGNPLTLDDSGNGPFKDYVKSYIIKSVQSAIDSGKDVSDITWATIQDGAVTDIDFNGYINYISRAKAAPAFDKVDLSNGNATAENSLFGSENTDNQHFTEFSMTNDTSGTGTIADSQVIKMMNPMNYIGVDGSDMANYWRIRQGLKDNDVAISTPVILTNELQGAGADVDFAVSWNQGHSGDYDLDELFQWMNDIV